MYLEVMRSQSIARLSSRVLLLLQSIIKIISLHKAKWTILVYDKERGTSSVANTVSLNYFSN